MLFIATPGYVFQIHQSNPILLGIALLMLSRTARLWEVAVKTKVNKITIIFIINIKRQQQSKYNIQRSKIDKQLSAKKTEIQQESSIINQIQSMTESRKINPELSVLNQKTELKKQRQNLQAMKNRVELLRIQLQKEKDGVKKHKQMTKETIQKKIEVNKINQWKSKDNSEELQRVDQLRKRNQSLRMSHQKQLQDIQKAIYLVKLDDAREVKNISDEHSRRLREMDREFLSAQREKKRKVAEESAMAKEKYMKYWKDKLAGIYTEQAQTIVEVSKHKEQTKKELQRLEEEEIKLMEQINRYHSQGVESKKEYLAAMSLPVKEVAEALESNNENSSYLSRRKSMTLNNSMADASESPSPPLRYRQVPSSKMPNAQVNQDKLKIILNQLKKVDRNSLHTSR